MIPHRKPEEHGPAQQEQSPLDTTQGHASEDLGGVGFKPGDGRREQAAQLSPEPIIDQGDSTISENHLYHEHD